MVSVLFLPAVHASLIWGSEPDISIGVQYVSNFLQGSLVIFSVRTDGGLPVMVHGNFKSDRAAANLAIFDIGLLRY